MLTLDFFILIELLKTYLVLFIFSKLRLGEKILTSKGVHIHLYNLEKKSQFFLLNSGCSTLIIIFYFLYEQKFFKQNYYKTRKFDTLQ